MRLHELILLFLLTITAVSCSNNSIGPNIEEPNEASSRVDFEPGPSNDYSKGFDVGQSDAQWLVTGVYSEGYCIDMSYEITDDSLAITHTNNTDCNLTTPSLLNAMYEFIPDYIALVEDREENGPLSSEFYTGMLAGFDHDMCDYSYNYGFSYNCLGLGEDPDDSGSGGSGGGDGPGDDDCIICD